MREGHCEKKKKNAGNTGRSVSKRVREISIRRREYKRGNYYLFLLFSARKGDIIASVKSAFASIYNSPPLPPLARARPGVFLSIYTRGVTRVSFASSTRPRALLRPRVRKKGHW